MVKKTKTVKISTEDNPILRKTTKKVSQEPIFVVPEENNLLEETEDVSEDLIIVEPEELEEKKIPDPKPTPRSKKREKQEEEIVKEIMTPRTKKRIDLDKQIENAGLKPLEKVVISDKNGPSVRYIKAQTKLGEPVLIDVDVQGMVATRPEDLKVREQEDFPNDLNSNLYLDNVYDETGMEFQGVSMECNDGVCVLSRDEKMRPVKTFLKKMDCQNGICKNLDMANVLPIIRFSDIVQNGTLIQHDISKAFKNLNNILYIKEKQKLTETDQFLGNLHYNFKESVEIIKDASKGLEDSIQKLTEFAQIYQETGVDDLEDREKYRLVIENLKIRNEKVQELIGALRTFNQMHDIVKKLDSTVSSVRKTLEIDFQNLNEDLTQ
jgi:hypothetical protein